jgi:hypothetical protein
VAIWNLFSKREARKRKQGQEDVFQYDDFPKPFRVQVIHIWRDMLGKWGDNAIRLGPGEDSHEPNRWWVEIFNLFAREKGVIWLSELRSNPCAQCRDFLMTASTEDALDLIEVTFQVANQTVRLMRRDAREFYGLIDPDEAIAELNGRFREHGIGYEFTGGEIIRVDCKYLHSEAVKPALQLLSGAGEGFSGPLQEFLHAHEYYRKGERKDAIVWACKAFESTLKAICTERAWPFDGKKDTASKLIDIVLANGLAPAYTAGQFTAIRTLLETGVPTVRNKTSGHGQGPVPTDVPERVARYALNMTASNIVFLIESHFDLK